jgi:hypothetical protein
MPFSEFFVVWIGHKKEPAVSNEVFYLAEALKTKTRNGTHLQHTILTFWYFAKCNGVGAFHAIFCRIYGFYAG